MKLPGENGITKLLDLAEKLSDGDPEYGTLLLLAAAACIAKNRGTYDSVGNEAWEAVHGERVQ